jgi:hypothetical protein
LNLAFKISNLLKKLEGKKSARILIHAAHSVGL